MYNGKDAVYKFIRAILNKYNYCRRVTTIFFNKNPIRSAGKEERFQQSTICWICGKLFDIADDKVRDHCHVSGKYRGAAHWGCNVNLKMTKKVPMIFHNLRGYDSHLMFKELGRFNVEISVIPNGLGNPWPLQ